MYKDFFHAVHGIGSQNRKKMGRCCVVVFEQLDGSLSGGLWSKNITARQTQNRTEQTHYTIQLKRLCKKFSWKTRREKLKENKMEMKACLVSCLFLFNYTSTAYRGFWRLRERESKNKLYSIHVNNMYVYGIGFWVFECVRMLLFLWVHDMCA